MNYRFFKDTTSLQFITNFTQVPELRPKVNDIVTFPPNRVKFVITRETAISLDGVFIRSEAGLNIVSEADVQIESEASTGVQDVSFDYFVRQQDTSYDTVSLRGSNDNVIRQLFRM